MAFSRRRKYITGGKRLCCGEREPDPGSSQPEPGSIALVAAPLVAFLLWRRQRLAVLAAVTLAEFQAFRTQPMRGVRRLRRRHRNKRGMYGRGGQPVSMPRAPRGLESRATNGAVFPLRCPHPVFLGLVVTPNFPVSLVSKMTVADPVTVGAGSGTLVGLAADYWYWITRPQVRGRATRRRTSQFWTTTIDGPSAALLSGNKPLAVGRDIEAKHRVNRRSCFGGYGEQSCRGAELGFRREPHGHRLDTPIKV